MSQRLQIVCVGGGWVAVKLVRSLRPALWSGKAELTVVSRDNFHTRRKTQLAEKLLAIFPGKPEGPDVCNTQTGNDVSERRGVALGEFAFHQRILSPVHELRERHLVVKVCGNHVRHSSLRDRHKSILHFLVAFIHRKFLVRLHQPACVVVNLLPESNSGLVRPRTSMR